MRKTMGMNKHQKAAHRPGEVKVSREEIAELLELSCSSAVEDRLHAAQYLCPCHVQARIPAVWDALFRMMEDPDRRVRQQAWHALEDGGLPSEPEAMARLEQIYCTETDEKVRKFAWMIIGKAMTERKENELVRQNLSTRPMPKQRGKCDFCGESNVPVMRDLNVTIPTNQLPRAALICDRCIQNA
ncbi:MAG: HEAT repeat domain-containing protein [Chloroflexi bacterium]|nr:HEAT repeat domain-containing protein [Chloroflexota bacterium]